MTKPAPIRTTRGGPLSSHVLLAPLPLTTQWPRDNSRRRDRTLWTIEAKDDDQERFYTTSLDINCRQVAAIVLLHGGDQIRSFMKIDRFVMMELVDGYLEARPSRVYMSLGRDQYRRALVPFEAWTQQTNPLMAPPEPESKHETETPAPSREPPLEPVADAAADRALQPWEQHAAVINLPRYDYRASGSLLLRSHSGFLITCPIKREKSATKEAISILGEYISHASSRSSDNLEPCSMEAASKKRKVCSEASEIEHSEDVVTSGNASESTGCIEVEMSSFHSKTSEDVDRTSNLSLVKLSMSGLLFFSFPNGGVHVVQMLTEVFHSLRSGKLKSPQWCHRIFPIQETCVLSETELHATVSKLFLDFFRNKGDQDEPIKFAVGYNRRGIDETTTKTQKNDDNSSTQQVLMHREQCFKVVAGAIKSVSEGAIVDLKSPEVAILVEVLPISGVPIGSLVAGVSVLPAELFSAKPRLCVKALVSDTKAKK
ncbi:hypothetical protein ACQ4PT_037692 [Festuca glaucescens]